MFIWGKARPDGVTSLTGASQQVSVYVEACPRMCVCVRMHACACVCVRVRTCVCVRV